MNRFVLVHATASLLFVAVAALQLNDPDPALWVATYLLVASVPLAAFLGYRLPVPFGVALGLTSACLLLSLPGFIDYLGSGNYALISAEMTGEKPHIESAREFLGIALAMSCLLLYWNWHSKSANT